MLKELPEANQKTLSFLMQFLQQYILPEKQTTKMDEDNLAMTLVPGVFGDSRTTGTEH